MGILHRKFRNFDYYTNYESSPATGLSTTRADERTKNPFLQPSNESYEE